MRIKECQECPFSAEKRVYTGDSFENVFKYKCKAVNKEIGTAETFDKLIPPKWCPLRQIKRPRLIKP